MTSMCPWPHTLGYAKNHVEALRLFMPLKRSSLSRRLSHDDVDGLSSTAS